MSEIEAIDQNPTVNGVDESNVPSPSSWNGRAVDADKKPAHSIAIDRLKKKAEILTSLCRQYDTLASRVSVLNKTERSKNIQKRISDARHELIVSIQKYNNTAQKLHDDPTLFKRLSDLAIAHAQKDMTSLHEQELKQADSKLPIALKKKQEAFDKLQKVLKNKKTSYKKQEKAEKKSIKATEYYYQLLSKRNQYINSKEANIRAAGNLDPIELFKKTDPKLKELEKSIAEVLMKKNDSFQALQEAQKNSKTNYLYSNRAEKKHIEFVRQYFQLLHEKEQYVKTTIDQIKYLQDLIRSPEDYLNTASFSNYIDKMKELQQAEAKKIEADAGLLEAQKKREEKHKKKQKVVGPIQAKKARKKLESAEKNLRFYAGEQEEAQKKYQDLSNQTHKLRVDSLYETFPSYKNGFENSLKQITEDIEKLEIGH